MIFYTITTFRKNISDLTKKTKDGYQTVMTDIRNALSKMPDNVLRETNDRVFQTDQFRIIKLRLPNSGQSLSKSNGFRLIYLALLTKDVVTLLSIYPKRGSQVKVNIDKGELQRLIQEYMVEYSNDSLEVFDLDQSGK